MEGEWSCYRSGHFNEGRMDMLQRWCLMEGEWSCYRGGIMKENGHVMEVASLKEGEWSCYRSGQFKGRSMVMLQRWPV